MLQHVGGQDLVNGSVWEVQVKDVHSQIRGRHIGIYVDVALPAIFATTQVQANGPPPVLEELLDLLVRTLTGIFPRFPLGRSFVGHP